MENYYIVTHLFSIVYLGKFKSSKEALKAKDEWVNNIGIIEPLGLIDEEFFMIMYKSAEKAKKSSIEKEEITKIDNLVSNGLSCLSQKSVKSLSVERDVAVIPLSDAKEVLRKTAFEIMLIKEEL